MQISFAISKRETLFIKGVGILMIMFHNFFHWLPPIEGENEFFFNKAIITSWVQNLEEKPLLVLNFLPSFLGHYGVQYFIFLSGFGLTMSYGASKIVFRDFIVKRLKKIYPVFLIVLCLIILHRNFYRGIQFTEQDLIDLSLRITMLANFFPKKVFSFSGPFWFYSMIIQLYLLFPLLVKLKRNYLYILFFVVFLFLYAINVFLDLGQNVNIVYYNFLGNLPVFILGILFGSMKHKKIKYNFLFYILLLTIFILGQYSKFFWPFSQIAFVVLTLPPLLFIVRHSSTFTNRFLIYFGSISMYLFAVNGFVRGKWVLIARNSENEYLIYIYSILSIVTAWIFYLIIRKLETLILKFFE